MPRIPKNGAVRPDKDNAYGSKAYRQTDSDCHQQKLEWWKGLCLTDFECSIFTAGLLSSAMRPSVKACSIRNITGKGGNAAYLLYITSFVYYNLD